MFPRESSSSHLAHHSIPDYHRIGRPRLYPSRHPSRLGDGTGRSLLNYLSVVSPHIWLLSRNVLDLVFSRRFKNFTSFIKEILNLLISTTIEIPTLTIPNLRPRRWDTAEKNHRQDLCESCHRWSTESSL